MPAMHRRHLLQQFAAISLSPGFFADAALASPPAAPITDGARQLAERVLRSADTGQHPFAIVDKHAAMIAVYLANGGLAGVSRTLLGRTRGDHSLPGVGERTQAGRLRPEDLTTPAGRFDSVPGRNRQGEAIVWLDYGSALAIHRLRPGPSRRERARRLSTSSVADKRVSAGCVVVPEAFYDGIVARVLGRGPGVVYVLPEEPSPRESWRALWREVSARQMA